MFLLIILFAGCRGQNSLNDFKLVKGSIQGIVPNGGYIERSRVHTKIDCATACAENPDCLSLFYTRDTRLCQVHDQKFNQGLSSNFQTNSLTTYYEIDRGGPVTTTTPPPFTEAPTTTTNMATPLTDSSPCPQDDTTFSVARTTDGQTFSFRIFKDVSLHFVDAVSLCDDHNAHLYKILTPERMAFTQSLMACTAYTGSNFWLNGFKTGEQVWITLDAEPIPMTNTFWYTGRPNNEGGNEKCLWMPAIFDHYFDDAECGSTDSRAVICEL